MLGITVPYFQHLKSFNFVYLGNKIYYEICSVLSFFYMLDCCVWTMDKVRKPNISVCYTPSSEPYSIYMLKLFCYFNEIFIFYFLNDNFNVLC
jgi:hypothetical protein